MSGRTIVAVDGIDGSGKTSFAAALALASERAGHPAVVVSVDDFRRPVDYAGLEPAQESAAYYERYYDFSALDEALFGFLSGAGSMSIPLFHLEEGPGSGQAASVGSKTLAFAGRELAIVEGVFPCRSRLVAGALLVRLEVDLAEAQARILRRDAAKGRGHEEIERRIERRYFPAQSRYLAAFDPVGRADLLIDNGDPAKPRVLRWEKGRFPVELAAALESCLAPAA